MKKHLILGLLLCGSILTSYAENTDSLRINDLEIALKSEARAREKLSSELSAQKSLINEQNKTIESLMESISVNAQNIKSTAEQLGVKIDDTKTVLETKADTTDLKSKATIGAILLGILLIICAVVYVLLHKKIAKGDANIEALRAKADKLNEEVLNQFSLEMAEMKKISDALVKVPNTGATGASEDHSLIKTLADRITFMEMTLYKMDPKVRGYKQLTKSISQMKDNLLANGYELVDMLGKPYNDGMKVTANFIEDEEIEAGKQIITGIIKPQINYKGTMIQAAQITVSQNI